jgi:hypothetical protein
MATKFNREAFAASPFMRSLTEADALSQTEKDRITRDGRRNDSELNWRCWREFETALLRARAANTEYSLAIHDTYDWRPGDARTAPQREAHSETVRTMCAMLDRWAAVPKRTKSERADFLQALKNSRKAVCGTEEVTGWRLALPRWEAACGNGETQA